MVDIIIRSALIHTDIFVTIVPAQHEETGDIVFTMFYEDQQVLKTPSIYHFDTLDEAYEKAVRMIQHEVDEREEKNV